MSMRPPLQHVFLGRTQRSLPAEGTDRVWCPNRTWECAGSIDGAHGRPDPRSPAARAAECRMRQRVASSPKPDEIPVSSQSDLPVALAHDAAGESLNERCT